MNDATCSVSSMKSGYRNAFRLIVNVLCMIGVASAGSSWALPQYAAIKGLTCLSCHMTAQGGGLRNQRGWRESKSAALVNPQKIGLGGLYSHDSDSNTLLNGRLAIGGDFRAQSARSHKSKDSNRRFFPMQASLYSSLKITEYLLAEGAYNFGPKKFLGQQEWSGSLIVNPQSGPFQLRLGFFQPSIGVRYDDHTMIIRQTGGADGSSLIPVNYSEYGAELAFTKLNWIVVTAGAFDSSSLAENNVIDTFGTETSLITDENEISYLGRIEVRKRNIQGFLNGSAGASYLKNDDFSLTNIFASVGLFERLSAMGEYAQTDKTDLRTTKNGALDISYRLTNALSFFVRGERGTTASTFGDFTVDTHTNQGVVGAYIKVLPYLEIRPEYRIVDTERYRSTRYAVQIHVYR